MARSLRDRFVASTMARETFVVAARVLGERGFRVMPLKGVLAQATLYDDPSERELIDVDVLVAGASRAQAAKTLRAAGFLPRPRRMSHEQTFDHPDLPLPLDLHVRLFPHFRYRMPTLGLFERAQLDRKIFGVPIWLPCPLDTAAHLVGHLATPNAELRRIGKYARDLDLLARRTPLEPSATAAHLVRCGLARAARYALPMLGDLSDGSFPAAVLGALPMDPMGATLASAAQAVVRAGPAGAMRGTVLCYLLSQSLPHAGLALGAAGLDRALSRSSHAAGIRAFGRASFMGHKRRPPERH